MFNGLDWSTRRRLGGSLSSSLAFGWRTDARLVSRTLRPSNTAYNVRPMPKKPKPVTAFRLTAGAMRKILRLAKKWRVSKTAVVETAIEVLEEHGGPIR